MMLTLTNLRHKLCCIVILAQFHDCCVLTIVDGVVNFVDFDFCNGCNVAIGSVGPKDRPVSAGVRSVDERGDWVIVLFRSANVSKHVACHLTDSILVSIGEPRSSADIAHQSDDNYNGNANAGKDEIVAGTSAEHFLLFQRPM